jgi:hypothetical protein
MVLRKGVTTTTGRLARLARRVALGSCAAVAAASALLPATAPAAHADVAYNQTITRSEVIARAQYWYHNSPTYSQKGTPAPDPEGTTYRRDCSGYVSMAWHLHPTGDSAPATQDLATSTYTTELSSSPSSSTDLQPGDILDDPYEHAFIFDKWDSASHTGFWAYSFGGTPVTFKDLKFTAGTWYTHPVSAYHAYRYKHITDDSAGTASSGAANTAGSCTSATSYPVSGASGLAIEERTCDERIAAGGNEVLHVSTDISWTGGGSDKLDGYTMHVQAQEGNVTEVEKYCSGIDSLINAHATGSESCSFTLTDPSSGAWTADGWLHAEAHGDSWLGPQYVGGAGSLSF